MRGIVMTSNASKLSEIETEPNAKDENLKLTGGVSWSAPAPTHTRRVAPSPPMVPKPDTNICLTARNFSVSMSADLWGISHPDTMDTLMNDQAVWPLRAREAVVDELSTVRERILALREEMLSFLRETEDILSVDPSPGADRLETCLSARRLSSLSVETAKTEIMFCLFMATMSAGRIGVQLQGGLG